MMKIGLIRCLQTESVCPASRCLEFMRDKMGAFSDLEEELVCVGVNTCGGCPGKNAAQRAKNMVRRGADAIAIASCIRLGTPDNFPCPFGRKIADSVRAAVGDKARVFDYTHEPVKKARHKTEPAGHEPHAESARTGSDLSDRTSVAISRLVASALDRNDFGTLRADMEKAFHEPPGRKQLEEALARARVYQIEASRPGYAPDGAPGYLSQDMDLRAELLAGLRNMAGADFDRSEHAAGWAQLEDRLALAPESQYREGLTVVCPDDYVLSLLHLSCAEALSRRGVNIWSEI